KGGEKPSEPVASVRAVPPREPEPSPSPAPPSRPVFAGVSAAADAARRELEDRLNAAEAEAATRRKAYAELLQSKEALERAVESHAAARSAWEREREELTGAVQSATAA